jgi:hypothetical protein
VPFQNGDSSTGPLTQDTHRDHRGVVDGVEVRDRNLLAGAEKEDPGLDVGRSKSGHKHAAMMQGYIRKAGRPECIVAPMEIPYRFDLSIRLES